jgi:hypothetical protein
MVAAVEDDVVRRVVGLVVGYRRPRRVEQLADRTGDVLTGVRGIDLSLKLAALDDDALRSRTRWSPGSLY